MSQNVAPWLQGLDDDDTWEIHLPATEQTTQHRSSASHDANSIRRAQSHIPRRSISSLHSSVRGTSQPPSQSSSRKRRSPLATMTDSNSNSLRRPLAQSRSFSGASDNSVLHYDTAQQRSKSSSPRKQETLEWKRRLVQGNVGYGDQTDLFGPSGLENIFAQTRAAEDPTKKTRSSLSWLDRSALVSVPSSPPPWPSRAVSVPPSMEEVQEDSLRLDEERLTTVDEERDTRSELNQEESFQSNPYQEDSQVGTENAGASQHSLAEEGLSTVQKPLMETVHDNTVANRTISGQTDVDDFSPVFISKHTTINGQVEYKALDSRLIKEFQNQTINLKHPSQERSPSHDLCETIAENKIGRSTCADGRTSESPPAIPDLSLSEDLPTGTPDVPRLGNTVQLKRGGYSSQGSFKERPLSASQSTAGHLATNEPSSLLSPRPSFGHTHPSVQSPNTPIHGERSEARDRSSGSPLKLFGPHDTFTTKRLWRRMSQLDPDLSGLHSGESSELLNEGLKISSGDRSVSGGSFGSGELNNHEFNAEITITSASDSDKANSDRSPGSEVPPPGSKSPLGFRLEDFTVPHDTFRLKRKVGKRSEIKPREPTLDVPNKSLQPTVEDAPEHVTTGSSAENNPPSMGAVSKRPPNSPFKAPTPKRRRTLHASELQRDVLETNQSFHTQLQEALSISSRKRRESRRGEEQAVAEASVLAQRKILRPRNPTPNQRRREQIEAEIRETTEQFATQEPEALEAVMEQIESSMASDSPSSMQQQANAVAHEVAKFSLRVQKASGEHTERKRSVTTQDFFNEAVMVMRLIREKAGRQSGLGSVAESDQEAIADGLELDRSDQDLSSLRVSRPPSREGGIGWRPRTSEQTDARVISHLRKYQEKDDTEFIAQSVVSLHVDNEQDGYVAVDEHSNIRIKGPLPSQALDADDDPSRPSTQHSQQSLATQSTQNSTASSTGRTVLSRKSDNVGTLAPDAVAHLIGEQVGAMTYDKDKQRWIKVKSPHKSQHGSFLEPPSNITSDDDPFREISDLPVDAPKEEEIRKASTGRRMSALRTDVKPDLEHEKVEVVGQQGESRVTSQETVVARPATSESNKSRHNYSSSDPSRYTALASSQHRTIETRATSWGHEELEQLVVQGKTLHQPLAYAAAQAALALAQHKGEHLPARPQNYESEASCPSPPTQTLETRAVEVACEDVVYESYVVEAEGEPTRLRDDTVADCDDSVLEVIDSPKLRQTPVKATGPPSSNYRGTARHMSLRRKTLTNKFRENEMVEQSELSIIAPLPGERLMSVSLSVSRPISKRQQIGPVLQTSSPAKCDPSHILSDLPDFTVNEVDDERPSERALAQRLARHAAAEVDDRYALARKDLVRTLADVQADEPYWEDLKQLDLHDRSLASLHGLDEFCGSVRQLDVSGNNLGYLEGAPVTIRHLIARSNQLSSLTPWTHLINLQYLDVSGNYLDNLDGLGCLMHLRELRADENQISSLGGITQLDGLLKLRVRGNAITMADFEGSQLHRLEELDLASNALGAVKGLEALQSLKVLNLDDNPLAGSLNAGAPMRQLKRVSLKTCGLQQLDVSNMPSLRFLQLDCNALSDVNGLDRLKSLDVLSMRRQTLPPGLEISILEQHVHARTIRLSENDIRLLSLPHGLLSLQTLELASVGLQELPEDFGLKMPNLTTLNLNFNSLRDIRPLLNIQKLESLSVCGNRLERLRKTIATLSKITTLTNVDLRDNHLTLGFYSAHICHEPVQTSVVRRGSSSQKVEDAEEKIERVETAKYNLFPGKAELDDVHVSRLDEETKLRRRVYQLLLGNSCAELETLDGLRFIKSGAMVRDRIWERLVELGIVKKTGGMRLRGQEEQTTAP